MEETKLDVFIRNETGSRKTKVLRAEEIIPAIVYGGDSSPMNIQVDKRAYQKIVRMHIGHNVLFHLSVKDGEKKLNDYSVLVKEEQHDPVSDEILHIDFQRVSLSEDIEVKVAIESKGEAVGVKKSGGSLDQPIWELDVICLPTKIPEKVVVDVSDLNIGDSIHVKDLTLPDGVKTEHDPEAIVFSVVPPMKEEPEDTEAEGEEAGSIEPEVIKKGKEAEKADAPEENAKEE